MKKLLHCTTFIFLLFSFLSCSNNSESDEETSQNSQTMLLTEMNLVRILASNGEEDIVNNMKYFYSDTLLNKTVLVNDDDVPWESQITYDNGKIVEHKTTRNEGTNSSFYDYASINQLNITRDFSRTSKLEHYFENGRLTETKMYSEFQDLIVVLEFEYNEDFNVKSALYKDFQFNREFIYEYTYDNNNTYYKGRGLEYELLFISPSELTINHNNTLSMLVYEDGEIIQSENYVYEYNSEGYPIKMETFNSENELVISSTFKYQ